jgi:hypothetical protein
MGMECDGPYRSLAEARRTVAGFEGAGGAFTK